MTPITRTVAMIPVLAALSACGGTSDSGSGMYLPPTAYTVGGTATGLSGDGLTLEMNDGSDLPIQADGTFTFSNSLQSGSAYSVTIKYQPAVPQETCAVTNGSGVVGNSDVGNVSVSCSNVARFVYVTDPDGQIAIYGITPATGALIPDGTVAIAPETYGMVAAPDSNFLYVLSRQSEEISSFAIDQNQGGLTGVNSVATTGSASCCMVISPNGSFIFVVNMGAGSQSVQTYMVDPATGALTAAGALQLPDTSCSNNICPGSAQLLVRPDGKYLYVLSQNMSSNTIDVTPYAIDPSTGALTPATVTTLSNTTQATMAIDPLGRFLYVANAAATTVVSASATMLTYAIDPATGALTAAGAGTVIPSNAAFMAPDSTGRYLYVIDNYNFTAADNNIIALAVDPSTGALSQIGTAVATGTWPSRAATDPSGTFLFMANAGPGPNGESWSDVMSFAIASSGVNAGAVSLAGQGAQYSATVLGENSDSAFVVIVE